LTAGGNVILCAYGFRTFAEMRLVNLTHISITGFRSIRTLSFPLRRLTVLVGANGVGKTNLYRSLELVHAAARGTLAEEIAREGGLGSIFFAGERRKHEQPRLALEAVLDGIFEGGRSVGYSAEIGFPVQYRTEMGFPQPGSAAFGTEAQVKSESLTLRQRGHPAALMERKGPSVWARDAEGSRVLADDALLASETALSGLRGGYPEIDAVRHAISSWRFYHSFRTDPDSPLRRPALAVTSPMLASDGSNLAAVFATLRYVREESVDLDAAVETAFPGARLFVPAPEENATFSMTFQDLPRRSFGAHELSDGTLQFLALMGALLAYRLPPFIALNEPETSLHPNLLPALARVIARAAERTQIWVVTHSRELADLLAGQTGTIPREVIRKDGATWLEGLNMIGEFEED
jgi:predicted ATPase